MEGWRRAGDGSEVKLGEGDGIFQGHNKPETKLGSAEEATDMTTGRGSAHPLADLSTKLRDGLLLLLHTPFNDTPLRPGASRRGRWGGQSLVLCRELTRRLSRPLRRGKLPLQILHLGLCHMPRCGTFIKESRKCPIQCILLTTLSRNHGNATLPTCKALSRRAATAASCCDLNLACSSC